MGHAELPDFAEARGRHLLVAVSGGADSVALLCLLAEARERLSLALTAAHVEHGLRGAASVADMAFCQSLCDSLGVPLRIARVDVPALARARGEGVETAARRARYEALRRIRRDAGADWIALAHHLDDQAETVLMHLLRGAGPDGAGGMAMRSGDLYRPLLNTPRRALEEALRARGVAWRTDATNFFPDTPRNALRLHGLPALEESYPAAARALARYAEAARCENRFMRALADDFLRTRLDDGPYGRRIRRPEDADEAVLRRALRAACPQPLEHDRLVELVALCARRRGRLALAGGTIAERTPNALYFLPPRAEIPAAAALPDAGTARLDGAGVLRVKPCRAQPVRGEPLRQALRRDALPGAVVRTRRAGDRIRPLGTGEKLLSDVLTDRGVDRPLRDFWPLVARGDRVLWAVGLCISADAALRPGDAAAELCWQPDAWARPLFTTAQTTMDDGGE